MISWNIILYILVGFGWIIFSIRKPLAAFVVVIFIFCTAYARLIIGTVDATGRDYAVGLKVGDLIWLGFLVGILIHWLSRPVMARSDSQAAIAYPLAIWLLVPYIVLASVLPIVGVLTYDLSFNYGVQGLRQGQWISFFFVAYYLSREYGVPKVWHAIVGVIVVAAVVHMAYAGIQLGYTLGLLDRSWIALDDLLTDQGLKTWFYYPRVTGLFTNPNNYGVFGALVFVLSVGMFLARPVVGRLTIVVSFVSSVYAMLFSASRSALLGVLIAVVILFYTVIRSPNHLLRGVNLGLMISGVVMVLAAFALPLLPDGIADRFGRFVSVLSGGAQADIDALGRTEQWKGLLDVYWQYYPMGTLVDPVHALQTFVDSYYMTTFIQGTFVFTATFILWSAGVTMMGAQFVKLRSAQVNFVGFVLCGWVGVILGSSIGIGTMSHPHVIVPLYTMLGIGVSYVKVNTEG